MYTGILLCRRCAGERGRAQEELLLKTQNCKIEITVIVDICKSVTISSDLKKLSHFTIRLIGL